MDISNDVCDAALAALAEDRERDPEEKLTPRDWIRPVLAAGLEQLIREQTHVHNPDLPVLSGAIRSAAAAPQAHLSEQEKAYFDSIKDVAQGPRPKDLKLFRMRLDGADVAVVCQRVLNRDATTAGFQPLALLVTREQAARLIMPDGHGPAEVPPDDVEGAA